MGELFVVATPIGNLEDISLRALRVLKEVTAVVAEDSRQTGKLLHHFGIRKPLIIFHEHSGEERLRPILERLKSGEDLAYSTDAGTPAVSDPGWRVVSACQEAGIKVSPIPGPSAITTILSVAGLPIKEFLFLGFLPKKKGRQTLLAQLQKNPLPMVFFERPDRLKATLEEFRNLLGNETIIVAGRELTKKFETVQKFKLRELESVKIIEKGEVTVLLLPPRGE